MSRVSGVPGVRATRVDFNFSDPIGCRVRK